MPLSMLFRSDRSRVRIQALWLLFLPLLVGCSSPPDVECPESMSAESYTIDALRKLTQVQVLETRLEEVNRLCSVPPNRHMDFNELLLKVAKEGTPAQAIWLYEKIQSYPVDFRKSYLAASSYLGINKSVSGADAAHLTLISPEKVGFEIKSAKITPEQAALAKTKYLEGGIGQGSDEGRRVVYLSDQSAPVLMQRILEPNAAGETSIVKFNSLLNGNEIALEPVAGEIPEWGPAGHNSRATGIDHGDFRFVVDQNGRVKYAIEHWISVDLSEVDYNIDGSVLDSTPCVAVTNVIVFSKNGLKYIPELEVRSNITYGDYIKLTKQDSEYNGFSDEAFSASFNRLAQYRPLPDVARYIKFDRNDDADQLLMGQLREKGAPGRMQLLNAIYAAYPLPSDENPKSMAESLIAKFDAAAGVVDAIDRVFSGIEPLMRAASTGLFETARAYKSVAKDLKDNLPSEPLPNNSYKLTTLFIKNQLEIGNATPYRFTYEAYRIPNRKPFAVVANHTAFSEQGMVTFYGKPLDGGTVQFRSSISGFSVEAPVIEVASKEQIEEMNVIAKTQRTYQQSIEKLKRLGGRVNEDYYNNFRSLKAAILDKG